MDNQQNFYPHINKPWMKYYTDMDCIEDINEELCLTSYLKNKNANNENAIAQLYYGMAWNYAQFWEKVDTASSALTGIGVKKGDTILYLTANIPEAGHLFLGAVQIGAVSDFIDPRPDTTNPVTNAKKILEIVKREKIDYIIALGACYLGMLAPMEEAFIESGIKKVILLNPSDSMDKAGKKSYIDDIKTYNKLNNAKLPRKQRTSTFKAVKGKITQEAALFKNIDSVVANSKMDICYYNELVEKYGSTHFEIDDNLSNVVYIGHTSGTSGSMPKPIVATNKQCISHLVQVGVSACEYKPGKTCLHMLPFFAPFGMFDNFLNPLRGGSCLITIPEFDVSEIGYLLKKYHPNVIMATPAWLVAIATCEYLQNENLSCLQTVLYGGDSMTPHDEKLVNEFLKRTRSNAVLEKGFGLSETLGCASYAKGKYNIISSIGIPMVGTTFAIVDPDIEDRLVPLSFGEGDLLEGELAISSDAVTLGILGDEIIVPRYDLDGEEFFRTNDIVSMNRNGVVFHQARKDRTFVRFDGYKYKPFEVENEILKHPDVASVMVVEYFDEKKRGNMPICHIVLKEDGIDKKKIVENIVNDYILNSPNMTSRQIPSKFRFRESIPQTKNGKCDFNLLKSEGINGTEITVDVLETNINVESIKIY